MANTHSAHFVAASSQSLTYAGDMGISGNSALTMEAKIRVTASTDYSQTSTSNLGQLNYTGGALGTEFTVTVSSPNTNISKTGVTKLGLREVNHDIANSAPTQDSYGTIASSRHATTTARPFYRITFAPDLLPSVFDTSTITENLSISAFTVVSPRLDGSTDSGTGMKWGLKILD